jgi:hypothetical protein
MSNAERSIYLNSKLSPAEMAPYYANPFRDELDKAEYIKAKLGAKP